MYGRIALLTKNVVASSTSPPGWRQGGPLTAAAWFGPRVVRGLRTATGGFSWRVNEGEQVGGESMKCSNCGSDNFDERCIYCHWREGEAKYCPHWMDADTWAEGVQMNGKGWEAKPKPKRKRGKKKSG